MKTSALVLIAALAGLAAPPAAAASLSQTQSDRPGTYDGPPCVVPDVVGMSEAAAIGTLRERHLSGRVERTPARAARGTVVAQRPAACSSAADGGVVIVVSSGQQPGNATPDRGRSGGGSSVGTAVGAAVIGAAILGAVIAAKRDKGEGPKEPAEPEKPAAAEPVAPEPPPVPEKPPAVERTAIVPPVTTLTLTQAQAAIEIAQLRALVTNAAGADDPQTIVTAQVPAAGTRVVPGATVAVTLAIAPAPTPAPPDPAPQPAPVQTPTLPQPPVVAQPPAATVPPPVLVPSTSLPVGVGAAPAVVAEPVNVPAAPIDAVQPSEPVAPVVNPERDTLPIWPWLAILVLVVGIAAARVMSRASAAPPAAPPMPAARLTFIARVDTGRQSISAGGNSRSLDFAVHLDEGRQRLRERPARAAIGALS